MSQLEVSVTTDRPAYRAGEPIGLALHLKNRAGAPVTLEFSTAQRYDFVIEDAGGGERWRWSADQMFAQMMGEQVVPPSWTIDYPETYMGRLEPGTYRARGLVPALGDTLAAVAEFVVR